MTVTYGVLSLILSMISAVYLQLPTFILALGYGWLHSYPIKRWIFRIAALITFFFFINNDPKLWAIILVGIPFAFFWVFSLFNANSNLFIALDENQVIKQKQLIYPADSEVVGYIDEYGNSICYPVNEMIVPRHLLNDVFEERPLFISFCAACRSTMIYNPVVDGQRLIFEVIGVHRRNMVIRDLQTGSVWQQATGEAMYGLLKGKQLEYHSYQQTILKDWLQQYPDTYIAKERDNIRKSFIPKQKLMNILRKVTAVFIAPGRTDLNGLASREKVWGLELNGHSKAYPVSELKKASEIIDLLGDEEIKIHYNANNNQIKGIVLANHKPLKFQSHWWFGWKEFHPETEIYKVK